MDEKVEEEEEDYETLKKFEKFDFLKKLEIFF